LSGDAYVVGSDGRAARVAGPARGLVALVSPGGHWVLVTSSLASSMHMELVNVASGEHVPLPLGTIADKCVWASDEADIYCGIPSSPQGATYPDDWYQGVTHFSDRVWK